jgi:NAD(P)-dependent dehydrogenase (short-subunit alcohol dehydrogenase family)
LNSTYKDISGKTYLITGASSGIGQAIAIALGELGANIILTGRNLQKLEETASQISSKVTIKHAELTNEDQIMDLIKTIEYADGVCHCAGIVKPYPVKFLKRKHLDEIFQINYYAPVLLTTNLLSNKKLNSGSSIVFISSVSSSFAYKGGAVYSSSKAAIEAFSRNIAIELAGKKIRSNCIKAAMVKTSVFKNSEEFISKELMEKHEKEYPLGVGEVNDVVEAALFLLSDSSSWVTGTTLTMDGGLTVGK